MPHLTAIQNIFINREINVGNPGIISPLKEKEMKAIAEKILHKEMKTNIPLDVPCSKLSLAQKQMIEIARTVYADAQIIIMDEPILMRNSIFQFVFDLHNQGKGVLIISSNLSDMRQICSDIYTFSERGSLIHMNE